MKISDERNEIAKAMNALQKQMRPAAKDSTNPHFKSKYSSYESTWEALRDPLTDNFLSCEQDIITNEKSVSVITLVLHTSGQWIEFGPLTMPVNKMDCQGFGSAISYAKRYALQAAFGIVSGEDDDGNSSAQTSKASTPQNDGKILPEQVGELMVKMKSCPPGFEKWLLDQVFKVHETDRRIENIPSGYFVFCKNTIDSQLQKQATQAPQEAKQNE